MSLLFDLCPLQLNKNNGGGEYCKRIFVELMSIKCQFDVLVFKDTKLDEEVENLLNHSTQKIRYAYSKKELNNIVNEYDCFYSALPYNYYYLKLNDNVKFIYTLHGLRDIEKPYDKDFLKYNAKTIKCLVKSFIGRYCPDLLSQRAKSKLEKLLGVTNNRIVIVVSNHTKYSLLTNFKLKNDSQINVLYSPSKVAKIAENSKEMDTEQYILLISGDRWLKNDLRAAIAIDQLISSSLYDGKVIITGVKRNFYKKYIKNYERFVFMDYVSTSKLENLYKNAALFVFPSLNEGFGYPPLEAMKYGTFCVCSDDTSISEICGNAVLYFNPYDVMEIRTRIYEGLKICDNDIEDRIHKQYNMISNKQSNDLKTLVDMLIDNALKKDI